MQELFLHMHVILNIVASRIHRYLKYWYTEFSTYAERFHNLNPAVYECVPLQCVDGLSPYGNELPKSSEIWLFAMTVFAVVYLKTGEWAFQSFPGCSAKM